MATIVALPPSLRNRIAEVVQRVRLLRFVRGLGLLTLILALGFGAALLADVLCLQAFSIDMPNAVRIGVLGAWGGIGLMVFLFGLLMPLTRRIDAAAVAAVIEQKYPELAERLTSSVELADGGDEFHGAPQLIERLMRDTETRSSRLDFLPAVSGGAALATTLVAIGVVALVLSPAAVWPGQYIDLTARFFQPWFTPATYAIDGTPAQDFAARGRTFTLTARVTQRRHVALPDVCTLVQIAPDGKETRTPMPRLTAKDNVYSATIKPDADFSYRVEAKPDSSATFAIETIQPVDLAANSPEITARPPHYAEETVEEDVAEGLADMSLLQNGTVQFECKLTRPAEHAFLDWVPAGVNPENVEIKANEDVLASPELLRKAVTIERMAGADKQTAAFTLPAVPTGKYRIRLIAERGVETGFPEHNVAVRADQPPQVKTFVGLDERMAAALGAGTAGSLASPLGQGPVAAAARLIRGQPAERKEILPYDRVPLEFTAADDVAVALAEIEYRVNRADPVREPIAATGYKTHEASAQDTFGLAGKVKPGDLIEYRVRITDNLPPEFGGPHVVYYPAEPLVLHVATEVEIAALRDDINSRLEKIKEDIKAENRGVYKTKSEARDRQALTKEQIGEVKDLKKENTATEKDLNELASAAELAPSFKALSDLARDVADKEMKESGKDLDKAAADHKTPAERDEQFTNTELQLDKAYERLDQLKKLNDELAAKAIAQENLAKLAEQEKALAEKAAELAAKDPVKDPAAKDQADQLKQQQQQTADELQKLTEQNPALKQALDQARAQEARDLADRAEQLAQQQRDLAKAQAETEKQQNEARLADLARKQQELADKANELANQTKEQAQTAKTNPLKPDDAQKAADALKQGDADQALKNQDQSAKELDRIADDLAKAIDLAKDPREAARQLARLEDALKQKAVEEAKKQNDPKPLAERLKPIQQEQKAIDDAIDRLSVPPASQAAQQDKKQAQEQAARVDEAVKQSNAWWAATQLDQAKQSLEKLANDLPSLDERKADALKQIAELRKQQDETARKAEQAAEQAKNADPNDPRAKDQVAQLMTDAARKQAETAEKLAKMDAPDQEARQQRTADALNSALKDLMDGRKADVPASQEDARRQLQRLEQALKGEKPADEKAAELAKRQNDLVADAAKAAADPKATPEQKDALKQQQAQVAQEAKNLDAPEAPQRKADAADAAQKAADAARADATSPEAQKQMQQAAKKLDELARQLNGQESEAARAQRLAEKQAEAAAQAQRDAQQPNARPNPATQQKEQQVAEEAKQLRAGPEAQAEKQRAEDALQKAQDAAPKDQAKAQREAADALHDLADKMAGRDNDAARANELAREQRDLAKQAANPDAGKDNPDELKKAADKQADIAHQLDRLDPKNAAEAKKDAAEKAADAARALDQAQKPADAADPLAKAADAADKLAKDLAQQQAANPTNPQQNPAQANKPSDSPRQAAQQLAQQERQLANQTQQAQNQKNQKPGDAAKQAMQDALQKVAQQQKDLNEQASQLPAGQQQKALEQAREAMNQAQQALEHNDAEQAKQRQNQAADALQQLANQLPQKADTAQRPRPDDAQTLTPSGLPNQQQADQARDLAKQQRELQDELRKAQDAARAEASTPRDNPVDQLQKQQQEVADQAAQAAQQAARNQGKDSDADRLAQQAQQTAQRAANQMQAGALQQAQQAGQQAAEQLHQLQKELAQTPGDVKAPAQAQNAERLAAKQDEINRQLQQQANNPAAQRAQQQAQQQNLQRQTNQLTQDVNRLAQEAQQAHQDQQANQAQQAAGQSHQAENAQQQAQQQGHQGNQPGAQQAQQQAAQALEQAAQQLAQAGQQPGQQPGQQAGNPPGQQPGQQPGAQQGQAVQQAQNAMQQAKGQLNQGQPQGAQKSMSQAAQALAQAAQQAGQDQQPDPNAPPGQQGGRFSANGVTASGVPDARMLPPEAQKYAGKPWGELPGELRTKIVQQMRVKYGDDYARMIKLYFEQAADTRDKK